MEMTLGDAGAPNDDASYAGDTGDSTFSLDYARNKAREFQVILNQLDETQQIARRAIDEDISPDFTRFCQDWITEFEAKRWQFRTAAEAVNGAAALVNGMGGRFPQLSIPNGLGALQFVIPAAVIGTIAALTVWGSQMISGWNERAKLELTAGLVTDPVKRDALLAAVQKSDAALASANNPLSNVAGIVKWLAIGVVGYFAFQAFQKSGYARRENPADDGIEEIDAEDDEGDD